MNRSHAAHLHHFLDLCRRNSKHPISQAEHRNQQSVFTTCFVRHDGPSCTFALVLLVRSSYW